jgi:hypothetical protein
MEVDPSRLRSGELIVGASGVVLLASVFLLKWYGLSATLAPTAKALGLATSVDGWDGLAKIRWLMLLTGVCALALVYLQAARPAPALPVTVSAVVTVLAILTTLALIYRVLLNPPGPDGLISTRAGAYVGLVSALVLSYGGYRSLRQEGIAERDAPPEAEVVGDLDVPLER